MKSLPFAMESWHSVVRGRPAPAQSLEIRGPFNTDQASHAWQALAPGESLVIVRKSGLGLLRSVAANRGRLSGLATWVRSLSNCTSSERSLAFPSTGGGFVLIDTDTREGFATGTRMLPAGRRRWKFLRRQLARLARFGLHERLGVDEVCVLTKHDGSTDFKAPSSPACMALSSGIPGLFQTAVAQLASPDGQIISYVKLGCRADSAASIRWEGDVLQRLQSLGLRTADTPELLSRGTTDEGNYIVQRALDGPRSPDELRRSHLDFLIELQQKTRSTVHFDRCPAFTETCERIKALRSTADSKWLSTVRAARYLLRERMAGGSIPCNLAHGDFTPWNTILDGDRLRVFDWEYARFEAPALDDLFHFIVQTQILVVHATDVLHNAQAVRLILARIREVVEGPASDLLAPIKKANCEWLELLLLYLLNIAVRDEWLHSKERPDFEQVTWLREARVELIRVVLQKLDEHPRTPVARSKAVAA